MTEFYSTWDKKGEGFLRKAKELKDFYPLSETDSLEINKLSGRRFDLNVMNEILRNMASRLKDKFFKTHQAFMNYMAKVFANEIRREEKVNNVNFKIISKGSEEERVARREQFLKEIENSLQVSPEWHFKKRLTSVLSPDKAYEVLKAYMSVRVEEGIFTLNLSKYIELSNTEKEIILSHAKSTHDGVVVDDEAKIFIETLRIDMPEKEKGKVALSNNEYEPLFEANIWGQIRKNLVDIFGKYVDKHWFSQLDAEVDDNTARLNLKAPSSFVEGYISEKYLHYIQSFATRVGFSVSIYSEERKIYYC